MRVLAVGGSFSETGGKPSGYIHKLFELLNNDGMDGCTSSFFNGGSIEQLYDLLELVNVSDVVLWFPNVDNNQEKIVSDIKKINPKVLLVTSKRNNNEYSFGELVSRTLTIKSNLCLEFTKSDVVSVRIFDPLGNVFVEQETRIAEVARVLIRRIKKLISFHRLPSVRVGPAIQCPDNDFFDVARKHAQTFHDLIHVATQTRMLGNLSFRCMSGFPSFRDPQQATRIFVSRRNVDKRDIGPQSMVAVRYSNRTVEYWGDHKPSVDTPIQLMLYDLYPRANYMLHSHTYIREAPFTENIVPCGAIEEFDEVKQALYYHYNIPFSQTGFAEVNLRGHGSLVLSNDLDYLRNIVYMARPIPEMQYD